MSPELTIGLGAALVAFVVGFMQWRAQNRMARIALLHRRLDALHAVIEVSQEGGMLMDPNSTVDYGEATRVQGMTDALTRLSSLRELAAAVYGPEVVDVIDDTLEWGTYVVEETIRRRYGTASPERLQSLLGTAFVLRERMTVATAPYTRRERLWGLSWVDTAPRWGRVSDELQAVRHDEPGYLLGSRK